MSGLSRILETSRFLSLCRGLRQPEETVFPGRRLRGLTAEEIRALEAQGNAADAWAKIRVTEDFSPQRVYGNFFIGRCVLGAFAEKVHSIAGTDFPAGIFFSTLAGAIVADNALIHRCPLVSRCVIDAEAAVTASRIEGGGAFGNGITLRAGIETGGRNVPVFYELDSALAEAAARGDEIPRREWEEFLAAYQQAADIGLGYVGKKSGVHGATVKDSFIGPWVQVDGACLIRGSTLMGEEGAQVSAGAGCIIEETVIRPGCRFDTQAISLRSFFADASGAERQAKITESYIGSNTHIAEGEVTSAFVGPFVSFHHQSLLIAAFWPGGRGNIGHGANLGSNHSSRAADGELWPGEGMFFGLGCNIKYPADYSASPYSIIATGVTTLPQKVAYPFSLIMAQEFPAPGSPSGYNRLIPAWVLKDNFYALWRSARKFGQRDKTPHLRLHSDPFHAGNIAAMREAHERLARPEQKKDVYFPGDIPGIGKNVLHEEDRAAAVETYAWFIRYARLRDLFSPGDYGSPEAEKPSREDAAEYLACLKKLSAMTLSSRAKDMTRGKKIISDYAQTHVPPEEDEVVIAMKNHCAAENSRIRDLFPGQGL
ncbi:MAG: DUF4954 family protein [Spirochaetaceae bacterium]|nr:DUF4954 family protein [Spirochaetaceae bacterium]